MNQFAARFAQLHPLGSCGAHVMAYLHDTTQDQVECAVFHSELMMRYKPSTIAFAAVLRTEDEIECPEFTEEMRARFLALQPKFELEPMEVLEARFVLENKIDIPIGFEEYKTMRRCPPPAPAPPAPPAWEREGAVSPTGVDYH